MKILIMGGTGAIGSSLVKILSICNDVFVTSRYFHKNDHNISYIQGDAKDENFLDSILEQHFDVIVDFMVYRTVEFEYRMKKLLDNSKQYVFISSSRCYANSDNPIVESSDRLLDVVEDDEYLQTDDYALAKAREEDLLRNSGNKNWTIIRPYITYNAHRLQLGCYEKEYWLYRVLQNKTLVIPEDIADSVTTITFGQDVANCIAKLIGNNKALGECFTVATQESHTWREIQEIYFDIIEKKMGRRPKVIYIKDSNSLYGVCDECQIKYDRVYNRQFNIQKLNEIIGKYDFQATRKGIERCINDFIDNPSWGRISSKYEAWADRRTKEYTKLSIFKELREKLRYIKWRFVKQP